MSTTKALLLKALVVCIIAMVCGTLAGVAFSLLYYGLIPTPMRADVYLSDTYAKMRLRFWLAFAAGAVFGAVWSYRIVKSIEFK